MESTFWLNNPRVLLRNKYMLEIWPHNEYSLERKLNAITRLITILVILGYALTKSIKIIVSFLEPIKPGLNRVEFIKNLETKIYNEIKNIS